MSLLNFDALKTRGGRDFVVFPFLEESRTPVGIDLRVGTAISVGHRVNGTVALESYSVFSAKAQGANLVIPAGGFLLFVTREKVWLSGRVAGFLFSRGSFASRGIILSASTIDPNWRGEMIMRLFNSNPYSVEVDLSEPVVTMSLFYTTGNSSARETRNPFRVVSSFASDIDGRIETYISAYRNSKEATEENTRFDEDVDRAKRYTYRSYINRKLRDFYSIIPGNSMRSKLFRIVGAVLFSIVATLILMFVIYWIGWLDITDTSKPINMIVFGIFTVLSNILTIGLAIALPESGRDRDTV